MGAKAGPLLALIAVTFLLADLFRGGSTLKDKILIIVIFLLVLASITFPK